MCHKGQGVCRKGVGLVPQNDCALARMCASKISLLSSACGKPDLRVHPKGHGDLQACTPPVYVPTQINYMDL